MHTEHLACSALEFVGSHTDESKLQPIYYLRVENGIVLTQRKTHFPIYTGNNLCEKLNLFDLGILTSQIRTHKTFMISV